MVRELIIPGIKHLELESTLPANYAGPILKGATIQSARHQQTEIVIQEIAHVDYAIRLVSGNLLDEIEAKGWLTNKGLHSMFMMNNSIRKNIPTLGKVHLKKDHYIMALTGSADCHGILDKKDYFQSLDISFSPPLLQQAIPYFPELESLLHTKKDVLIGDRTFWTPPFVKEIHAQILQSPYEDSTQLYYFDLKVREILFHLLQHCLQLSKDNLSFSTYETSMIHEAKYILETYIDKKPPTIRELARMVAINEFKLKQGFRKYFNSGIFGWITTQKMYRAKYLLENTNKPMKEIAAISGYPRITNFITAFRKQFGITPGSFRR